MKKKHKIFILQQFHQNYRLLFIYVDIASIIITLLEARTSCLQSVLTLQTCKHLIICNNTRCAPSSRGSRCWFNCERNDSVTSLHMFTSSLSANGNWVNGKLCWRITSLYCDMLWGFLGITYLKAFVERLVYLYNWN